MQELVRFVVPDARRADRFRSLLDDGEPLTGATQLVAVLPWPADPVLALRLVEAGVHQVAPAVDSAVRHELADRWWLRRHLRLRWDGDTRAFLRLVDAVPDPWWLDPTRSPDQRFAADLERLRRCAVDVLGAAPGAAGPPSVTALRRLVCLLWGRPSCSSRPPRPVPISPS